MNDELIVRSDSTAGFPASDRIAQRRLPFPMFVGPRLLVGLLVTGLITRLIE